MAYAKNPDGSYVDLEYSRFPAEVDSWQNNEDVTAEYLSLANDYKTALLAGNYENAQKILNANPQLKRMMITAEDINKTKHATMALERMFTEDIEAYVKSFTDKASSEAEKATTAATNAALSERNANNSKIAAKESETKSAASEVNALKSAENADSSATAASGSAQAAKISETNAEKSAKAAEKSEANAKIYAERAQSISEGYKGWYQTEKDLAADLPTGKNGDWAIVGESDTIWVWDGDASKWKCSAPSGVLNTITITVPAKEPTENSVMWVRLGRLENTSDMDTVRLEIGGSVKAAYELLNSDGHSKENNVLSLGIFSIAITDIPQNDVTDLSSAYEVLDKIEPAGGQRDVLFAGVEDITQTTALADETPEGDGATASGSDSTKSISFSDVSSSECFVLATKGGNGTSCADVWLRLPYTMYESWNYNDISYHLKIGYSFNLDCRWYGKAGLFSYDGTQTLVKPTSGTNQKKRLTVNLVSTDNLGDGLAGDYTTPLHVTPATKNTIGGIKVGDNITVDDTGSASITKDNVTTALGFSPAKEDHTHHYAGSSTAGGTANSVNSFTFKAQTSDPGAGSSLATGTILFVYS